MAVEPIPPDLVPLGDRAWLARFGDLADARRWADAVARARLVGVADVALAYRDVAIHLDPDLVDADALAARLMRIGPGASEAGPGRLVTIPVFYDGDDLDDVAGLSGLDVDAVIAAHSGPTYDVFAIGFQPGFPYAGPVPPPLDRAARRSSPRPRVAAGSVALAAGQTGIYPADLPGGWNLLGRTPLTIVDLATGRFPIRPGDRLRFVPIGRDEFASRRGEPLQ